MVDKGFFLKKFETINVSIKEIKFPDSNAFSDKKQFCWKIFTTLKNH